MTPEIRPEVPMEKIRTDRLPAWHNLSVKSVYGFLPRFGTPIPAEQGDFSLADSIL